MEEMRGTLTLNIKLSLHSSGWDFGEKNFSRSDQTINLKDSLYNLTDLLWKIRSSSGHHNEEQKEE